MSLLPHNGKVFQRAAVLIEQMQKPRLILSVRNQGEAVSEKRSACQSEKGFYKLALFVVVDIVDFQGRLQFTELSEPLLPHPPTLALNL